MLSLNISEPVCWLGSFASSFALVERHLTKKIFKLAVGSFLSYVKRRAVKRQAIYALRPLKLLRKVKKLISRFVSKAVKNAANLEYPGDLVHLDQHLKEPCMLPKRTHTQNCSKAGKPSATS